MMNEVLDKQPIRHRTPFGMTADEIRAMCLRNGAHYPSPEAGNAALLAKRRKQILESTVRYRQRLAKKKLFAGKTACV